MRKEALTSKTERAEREDRPSVGKDVIEYRKKLHRAIVKRMMELDLCTSDDRIECFKRRYLFDCHSVETSRALDLQGLKNAIDLLNTVDVDFMTRSILLHYKKYESLRDLVRCSKGQVGKLQAVGLYSIKLSKEALADYASSSLHRAVTLYDLSVEEAHQVIKRLEEWEAKVLMSKKKKEEVKK